MFLRVNALCNFARKIHPFFKIDEAVAEVLLNYFSESLHVPKIDEYEKTVEFVKLGCLYDGEILIRF
jgi:hypothetical protein